MVKNLPIGQDLGSIPGLGRSPWEGNDYPLQYSHLENSMDRGAWGSYSPWGCKQSDTTEWLVHTHTHTHTHIFYVWLFVTPWIVAHPGSSVHGISQARILEWFAISFSRGYSQTCSLGVPRPGILHWQADLLCLSHKGSPFHNPGSLLMYFP